MTDEECSPDELRTLFLFEKLTDAQLEWLCPGRVEVIPAGPAYAEGDRSPISTCCSTAPRCCRGGWAATTSG